MSILDDALRAGDLERARRLLAELEVRCVPIEPDTLEGTFVVHSDSLEVIERAARSWEAFDRLSEPDDDDWTPQLERFVATTGLADWGYDHVFVRGRRVAAFTRATWAHHFAGWMDEVSLARSARARALGL